MHLVSVLTGDKSTCGLNVAVTTHRSADKVVHSAVFSGLISSTIRLVNNVQVAYCLPKLIHSKLPGESVTGLSIHLLEVPGNMQFVGHAPPFFCQIIFRGDAQVLVNDVTITLKCMA